jgi:hypothetical protein
MFRSAVIHLSNSSVGAIAVFAFCALAIPAWAEIEINVKSAEYSAGVLVVSGSIGEPNKDIKLDQRYTERSNQLGQFLFRVRYLPDDCTVHITAGGDTRTAHVSGCAISD